MPDETLQRLLDGNRRFVEGRPREPLSTAERHALAEGQAPFAAILTCSDSRAPVETILDQRPGDLFVVRVAGNFVNDDGLASIEYAISVLSARLIVVIGHTACGGVRAALQFIESGTPFPGHIQRLADAIAPAATRAQTLSGDWMENAVSENVKAAMRAIETRSSIIGTAIREGRARVVGAIYDLHSGRIELVEAES